MAFNDKKTKITPTPLRHTRVTKPKSFWKIWRQRPVLIGSFIWNPSPNHFCNFSISQNIYKKRYFKVVFPLYVDCCDSSVLFSFLFFFSLLGMTSIAYISKSKSRSFRKSSWKKFLPPFLTSHTLILKLHTVFLFFLNSPIVLVLSASKNPSLHAFSSKQEAKSSCAYWEEVTSLPCRKYIYSIIRSSRCLIGLVCPVLPFPLKLNESL